MPDLPPSLPWKTSKTIVAVGQSQTRSPIQTCHHPFPLPPLTNLHINPVIKDQHRYLMRKLRCGGCWHIQLCPDPGHQQRNVYSLLRQSGDPVSEFRCYPGNFLAKHWSPAGWPLLSGSMTSLFLPESKCSEDLWRPGLENSCLLK